MIRSFNGKTPKIARSVFVSQTACVIGDVEIGENCGIWPGAVIRADFASIKIGRNTDIEDNSVLHVKTPMEIGENVVIGHAVTVHCSKVGNNTLIGSGAILLNEVEIGDNSVIAAGSVVTGGTKILGGSFVAGVPAEVKGKVNAQQGTLVDEHYRYYTKEFKKFYREHDM
ncbi:MAG: gamma carbonic anhydrase family protein [Dehalococcoidales bacterium]